MPVRAMIKHFRGEFAHMIEKSTAKPATEMVTA
jgi:hypothetical protein